MYDLLYINDILIINLTNSLTGSFINLGFIKSLISWYAIDKLSNITCMLVSSYPSFLGVYILRWSSWMDNNFDRLIDYIYDFDPFLWYPFNQMWCVRYVSFDDVMSMFASFVSWIRMNTSLCKQVGRIWNIFHKIYLTFIVKWMKHISIISQWWYWMATSITVLMMVLDGDIGNVSLT